MGSITNVFSSADQDIREPVHLNLRPDAFSPVACGPLQQAALATLRLENGYFADLGGAPIVLDHSGESIVEDYSSRYSRLAHFYDFDSRAMIKNARYLDGIAIVISDDIRPLNYCHWIVDWLPRLAFAGTQCHRPDCYVVTPPINAPYQRESLRLCGFSDERIIEVREFEAIRARELIVPSDITNLPHPAHSGAPWALRYLRTTIRLEDLVAETPQRRLYVSRKDAASRRVVNELELLRQLQPLGFDEVSLAGMSVIEQRKLFSSASHVIAPHGAGLTNLIFCQPATTLIEIFSETYSLGTYYVLCAALGFSYSSYVASAVATGVPSTDDDMLVDVEDFVRKVNAAVAHLG